jgi:hypothetical protein
MKRNYRRRLISAGLAVALAMFGLTIPTPTNAAVIVNNKVPITIIVSIPCVPEIVILTGELHVLTSSEVDSNGGIHFKTHAQPQGISGVGLVTGVKYQGTGVTQRHTTDHSGPALETTFVNNFRIIGQGPDNNLLVHTTMHLTINANGELTANVLNSRSECK